MCPHKDHRGAFGQIAYIPCCRKVSRNLPYRETAQRGSVHAVGTGVIPDWCPLQKDYPDFAEALKIVHDHYQNLYEFRKGGEDDPKLCRLYEDLAREQRNLNKES